MGGEYLSGILIVRDACYLGVYIAQLPENMRIIRAHASDPYKQGQKGPKGSNLRLVVGG